ERTRTAMQVGEHRRDVAADDARLWRIRRPLEIAFTTRPAVVTARHTDVDFFDRVVANVPDPELPGRAIEAHAKRVAEPVGPDLAARVHYTHEGVVGGRRAVEVEAQNLAVERREILGVRIRRRSRAADVVAEPAVAGAHPELLI